MNWGYKIIAIYVIFVSGIITLVVLSSRQNQDLVTEDYYEQELKYQDRINESASVHALSDTLTYTVKKALLIITLPPEMAQTEVSADILLYNPADKKSDQHKKISSNSGTLIMPFLANTHGWQTAKLSWEAAGKKYYTERKILVP